MSNKREREKRREEREQQEGRAQGEERRKRLLQLGSAAVFVVVIVVVALIVASGGGSDGGDTKLEGVKDVDALVGGLPQDGLTLGDPKAKVTLVEFGDLQCPVCKAYSEEVLPQVIKGPVKAGKAKIEFRNFVIISEESIDAGAAALAAGEQGRGWQFLELFYRNQGIERSGYVTDDFLEAVAKGAGVRNLSKWQEDRKSKRLLREVNRTTAQAQRFGFSGTPSFAVEGPAAAGGIELLGTVEADELEAGIEKAAGGAGS